MQPSAMHCNMLHHEMLKDPGAGVRSIERRCVALGDQGFRAFDRFTTIAAYQTSIPPIRHIEYE